MGLFDEAKCLAQRLLTEAAETLRGRLAAIAIEAGNAARVAAEMPDKMPKQKEELDNIRKEVIFLRSCATSGEMEAVTKALNTVWSLGQEKILVLQ
jgi:hypothetical protein